MIVGILVSSINNFGSGGYYNSQEIGLAKAMSKLVDEVVVYKAVNDSKDVKKECISGYENLVINYIPAKHLATNGFPSTNNFNKDLDIFIHFSDTQHSVPLIYKWCKINHIEYVPYVGAVRSTSRNVFFRPLSNLMSIKNLNVYRRCRCFAKTPYIAEKLKECGIRNVILAPVGLDTEIIPDVLESRDEIRINSNIPLDKKVLLFVGCMEKYKRPFDFLEILKEMCEDYWGIVIGNGRLEKEFSNKIKKYNLEHRIIWIKSIQNSDIHKFYKAVDYFLNFNDKEIFGMSIMEAMFQCCTVIARKAPGPSFVIEDGVSGYISPNREGFVKRLLSEKTVGEEGRRRIESCFLWDSTASIILSEIKG